MKEQAPKIVHDTILKEVLLKASRVVEVRISQFRAILVVLLMIFNLQLHQLRANSSTFYKFTFVVALVALCYSAFVIFGQRNRKWPVTLLAICSIGLDATLMVLPVSLYLAGPKLAAHSGVLLNQPPVFAMYLLVIASGLRFRKVATLGIIVNSLVILSLMFMEVLSARLLEAPNPISSLAIKQHLLLLIGSALLAQLISSHTRVTTEKAANAALQATTDALTGTFNRHHLREKLESLYQDLGQSVHLIILDADHFKSINDNLGHLVGDRVLVEIANRLQLALRPDDVLARYGGEEFCVVLAGIDNEVALAVAERLRCAIASKPIEGEPVTISLGVSRRVKEESISQLLKRADLALYRSKEGGRNQVQAEWPGEGEAV